jgi:hypothetical protein
MQAEAARRVEALLGMGGQEEDENRWRRRKPPRSVIPAITRFNGQQFVAPRANRSVII